MTQAVTADLKQVILAAVAAGRQPQWAVGVIATAPTSGPATVTWQDGEYETTSRLESYTPTVGDVVLMARPPNQLVILGRIV